MRVIAGEARGRRLEALPGTEITRPTMDQVKEAMFSIVQFDLPGARVLDLYAGSGQLGIEALSRGAARCVFLDENREAVNIVMKNCKNCGVFDRSRVNIGEAARYLSACHEQFDIVLLDPPFHTGTLEKILPGVDKCLAPGGIVICESETGQPGAFYLLCDLYNRDRYAGSSTGTGGNIRKHSEKDRRKYSGFPEMDRQCIRKQSGSCEMGAVS